MSGTRPQRYLPLFYTTPPSLAYNILRRKYCNERRFFTQLLCHGLQRRQMGRTQYLQPASSVTVSRTNRTSIQRQWAIQVRNNHIHLRPASSPAKSDRRAAMQFAFGYNLPTGPVLSISCVRPRHLQLRIWRQAETPCAPIPGAYLRQDILPPPLRGYAQTKRRA